MRKVRWTSTKEHYNADNERLLTVVIYAPHETSEHVRKDNWKMKHKRKLILID